MKEQTISDEFLTSTKMFWNGKSGMFWLGIDPFHANSMFHNIDIHVNREGVDRFSSSTSRANILAQKESYKQTYTYNYFKNDKYSIDVDYSYYATLGIWWYVGQKSWTTFKFRSNFYNVDSKGNKNSWI